MELGSPHDEIMRSTTVEAGIARAVDGLGSSESTLSNGRSLVIVGTRSFTKRPLPAPSASVSGAIDGVVWSYPGSRIALSFATTRYLSGKMRPTPFKQSGCSSNPVHRGTSDQRSQTAPTKPLALRRWLPIGNQSRLMTIWVDPDFSIRHLWTFLAGLFFFISVSPLVSQPGRRTRRPERELKMGLSAGKILEAMATPR